MDPYYQEIVSSTLRNFNEAKITYSIDQLEQIRVEAEGLLAKARNDPSIAFTGLMVRRQEVLEGILKQLHNLGHTFDCWSSHCILSLSGRLLEDFDKGCKMHHLDAAIHIVDHALHKRRETFSVPETLLYLAKMLRTRFIRGGQQKDLDRAIDLLEETLKDTRGQEPSSTEFNYRHDSLISLWEMLGDKFDTTGSIEHMDRTIELYPEVLQVTTDDAERAWISTDLGTRLFSRYFMTGSAEDITRAIDLVSEALGGHPNRAWALLNLHFYLFYRSGLTGSVEDLNRALDVGNQTLEILSTEYAHVTGITYLGDILVHQFQQSGSESEIDRAVEIYAEAPKLQLLSPTEKAIQAKKTRMALKRRSKYDIYAKPDVERPFSMMTTDGRLDLIRSPDSYIFLHDDDLELERLDLASILEEFGKKCFNRFDQTSSVDYLNDAIRAINAALIHTPKRHPSQVYRLSLVGIMIYVYSGLVGEPTHLERAVGFISRVMEVLPNRNYDRLHQSANLVRVHFNEFERNGSMDAIARAIKFGDEFRKLIPLNHPERGSWLEMLGKIFNARFNQIKSTEAIDTAVEIADEAVLATHDYDDRRAYRLGVLGSRLITRYRHTESIEDIDRAIEAANKAFETFPLDYYSRLYVLQTLGSALLAKHGQTKSLKDIKSFLPAFQNIRIFESDRPSRIILAEDTTHIVSNSDWDWLSTLVEAIVRLLPLLIRYSQSPNANQRLLRTYHGLASTAVACILQAKADPQRALRILELGRGIVAGLFVDLRGNVSRLMEHYPSLAVELLVLRDILDKPDGREISYSLEWKRIEQRTKAEKRTQEIVAEIRALPQFSEFLLPPIEDELMATAGPGAIIVINVHTLRCDAMLIERHRVTVLDLPGLILEEIDRRVLDLQIHGSRAASYITSTLEWLWVTVAGPCLDALGYKCPVIDNNWPHVWWIPTGPLSSLPLHAAGRHMNGSSDTVIDRVISSYSLSVKTLEYVRKHSVAVAEYPVNQAALLVAMENTSGGLARLPFAEAELSALENLWPSLGLTPIRLEKSTRQEVLDKLKSAKIFHFAGHSLPDPLEPSNSILHLEDWQIDPLTMGHLRGLRLQDSDSFLAYLSACSTNANKVKHLADEGVSIVIACQLAGFRHVIGTLWEVSDPVCVEAARIVYETLSDEGLTDAAVARGLHFATRALRDRSVSTGRKRAAGDADAHAADGQGRGNHADRDGKLGQVGGSSAQKGVLGDPSWVPYVHYGA